MGGYVKTGYQWAIVPYGKLISEYSWLYDPLVAMKITINNQLQLAMLAERLTDAGFKIDSCNTDGLTTTIRKDKKDLYHSICKQWEKETELELEYNQYKKVFRRDVNSYIAVFENGKTKEKGYFLRDINFEKGFDKPVVKKAIYEHFINGINFEDYIRNHDDIYDFCMMQKMNSDFQAVHNGKTLQKTNRFYASADPSEGYMFKVKKKTLKQGHVLKDSGVTIFNDFVDKPMKDYKINYQYYIKCAREVIDKVDNPQLTLF